MKIVWQSNILRDMRQITTMITNIHSVWMMSAGPQIELPLVSWSRMLTVNKNRTSWLCICAGFDLLLLRKMLMAGLVCAITVHRHHIQDDAMVNDAVDRSHRGHRTFEYSFPFAEHEIGRDQHRFAFIALGKKGKEHLHFVAIVLDIADIIEDHTSIFVQLGQFLGEAQVPFGGQKPLYEGTGGCP